MKYVAAEIIKQINDDLERSANNRLRSIDMTMAQFGMLYNLYESKTGKLTMKDLERELHVAQSTATGIATRLEKKGMVENFASSDDKRIKVIGITSKGRQICMDSEVPMKEAEENLLQSLNVDERKMLIELLAKVRKSL